MTNIIKRDNSIEEFNKEKIVQAILKAMKYGSGIIDIKIAKEIASTIESTAKVLDRMLTVSEIEGLVFDLLVKKDHALTARCYEGYRAVQEYKRKTHPLDESVMGLVDFTNEEVITENSNKQAVLASTQRDLIAGEVSKYVAKTKMIPAHIVQAHEEGIIKIHDLDYYLQPITNCELVPLGDMFKNGTVINKKLIETPKSLRTASTLATQIAAQVSSFTYGGQTMSLSHLAPYVRVSKNKIQEQVINEGKGIGIKYTEEQLDSIVSKRLKSEIKDSVQTFNYQLSTLNSTNGQSPFLSLCMYISEDPEYEEETAMLIEEFLNQRIEGMKNEYGVTATPTFPKLLFFLDENNMYPDSKYYYLKQLAIKSTALRMNPDFISVKKMKELYGYAFPCMGCRSFLAPYFDENGKVFFYGRGNLGVVTLNLPHIALTSKGDMNLFWKILDERLALCKEALMLRYTKLKGVKAKVAPILWQHGVFGRLDAEDEIEPLLKKFTISLGYIGLYETTKYMTGEGQTEEVGYDFALKLMTYLQDTVLKWKEETGLGFALYGTPSESTAGYLSDRLKDTFGEIKDITDKGWLTNSYHVDIREQVDAFTKLSIESKLQEQSLGGNVSYVEVNNLCNNLEALEQLVDFMYENNIYAEVNSESDVCGACHYEGIMSNDPKTLDWYCPVCGNKDQSKLSVVRRVCGYLGETVWTKGRKLDILNRVKHL